MTEAEVSLKEYIDTRIRSVEMQLESQAKFIAQHFQLNENAIGKAEKSMTMRLDGMNEFRAQINKERGDYVSKDRFAIISENMDSRIKSLEEAKAFSSGRMWMVMAILMAIPTVIALVALIRG